MHYLLGMSSPLIALAQSAVPGSKLVIFSQMATIVIALALVALLIVALTALIRINRMLEDLRGRAEDAIGPVSDRAKIISDNLEFITQSLRSDLEKLNSSIRILSERLNKMSGHIGDRLEDFNALIEVIQREAEELFIDTASTMRGFRAGAREITSPSPNTGEEVNETPSVRAEDEPIEFNVGKSQDGKNREVEPPNDAVEGA